MTLLEKIKKGLTGFSVFALFILTTIIRDCFFQKHPSINSNNNLQLIYTLLSSLVLVSIIFYIYENTLKKSFRDLRKNHQKYFSEGLKYWLFSLFFMFLFNLILLALTKNNLPANEKIIRESFKINPLIIFMLAVVITPFLEELVFRQGFRDMIKNDFLFILISSFIFGALHVIGGLNSYFALLYILPYMMPGIAFGIILIKTNNILVPIGFHFLHNGVLIALQFALLIFG